MSSFDAIDLDDGLVRLELNGRLDSAGVQQIEPQLIESVGQADKDVLIDLHQVGFVGSLGIRMLVSAARKIDRAGRSLMLTGVQAQVLDVFETVGLGELIPIVANADEARQRLSA